MMAIFPGFLFRKFYYRGEFTKQFSQSNEFDKLLWNLFFSALTLGFTALSIYFFRSVTELKVLSSLGYDTISQLAGPIADNKIPQKKILDKTYKDLLIIIVLIYSFACFFGFMLHWLVRILKLDVRFSVLRFKNYWYYYIHGGRILYNKDSHRNLEFTVVDVLCEFAGGTKLYSGILSQYTINKDDNNLENIFLTNAKVLKQIKDEVGNTVKVEKREIPGATFSIPYKNVVNINFSYVYKEVVEVSSPKIFGLILNISFFVCYILLISSLWFDLSKFGIIGFWDKLGFLCWSFVGLTNFRLLLSIFNVRERKNNEWVGQMLSAVTSVFWVLWIGNVLPLWLVVIELIIAIYLIAKYSTSEKEDAESNTESKDVIV